MTHVTDENQLLEIAVEVAGIDSEIAADLLRQVCPGGVVVEIPSRLDKETETYVADGDAPALVKGYLTQVDETSRILKNMRLALQSAPLQHAAKWHRPKVLENADWLESWKRYFGVLRIGRRVVIVPSWVEHTPKPDDVIIRIDPGMAFGTGQHQTTAMCLAALEIVMADVKKPVSVLDLGCGSGILAIAAAKLGADRVVAIDTDPQAIKATTENAKANGVQIESRIGSIDAVEGAFDIIVANISGVTLERLAPQIARALLRDGDLIISGFLAEAESNLHHTFESYSIMWTDTLADGEWRAMIFNDGRR